MKVEKEEKTGEQLTRTLVAKLPKRSEELILKEVENIVPVKTAKVSKRILNLTFTTVAG